MPTGPRHAQNLLLKDQRIADTACALDVGSDDSEAVIVKDETGTMPGDIPSLNGIRAISVIIVLLSHAGFEQIVPGGLGVTIFFFLSGFLITTLLLREQAQFGSIDIPAFYLRRFYRLIPPLLVTLAIAYGLTYVGILAGNITPEGILVQLFYFANYFEIFFDGSAKIPAGTGVLWSLAVEEHFYIVFPLVMSLGFLIGLSSRSKLFVALALCGIILLWRIFLVYGLNVPASRTYYGSDTRFDSILYGCILAFAAATWGKQDDRNLSRLSWPEWVLLAGGLLLLSATFIIRDPQFRETFRYSLQGIALIPIFHLAVNRPQSWPFRFLDNRFLVRLGIYSYSIYLIHRVLIVALFDNVELLAAHPVLLALASFGLSVLFAAFVDRYVDRYFRRRRARMRRATITPTTAQTVPG